MEEKIKTCFLGGCDGCLSVTLVSDTVKVCVNEKSEHFGETRELRADGCSLYEDQKAYDYKHMTAWQFASKYYN